MADRNEADALFATKRKKQQEEQAEQERREEMSRKKAEMEAEIRRLEEEAKRQKEQQEEARRQAQEEARRANEEAREAEARAARAEELAKQAQLKQEEVRREEERRAREKREEEKRAQERMAQERAQARAAQKAQNTENRKQEAAENKTAAQENKADTQPVKKQPVKKQSGKNLPGNLPGNLPILPLAIGGAVVIVAAIVICLVLLLGGKKGGVFGTDCNMMAYEQVMGYTVFYPESFEEGYGDGGVLLNYGSAEGGDYSFVTVFGDTRENLEAMVGSSDTADILRGLGYSIGAGDLQIYEMTTDSGLTVNSTSYFVQDVSGLVYTEEGGVTAEVALMILPLGDEYLVALYGTMNDSYMESLEETVVSILDNVMY